MTGARYRKLLLKLGLHAALKTQLHAGFRPDFHHELSKYDSHYLAGSDYKKAKPPPLTEDYSKLGRGTNLRSKWGSRKWWASLTPAQRAIQVEKRRRNASNWPIKSKAKGHIFTRYFVTKYTVIRQKPKP